MTFVEKFREAQEGKRFSYLFTSIIGLGFASLTTLSSLFYVKFKTERNETDLAKAFEKIDELEKKLEDKIEKKNESVVSQIREIFELIRENNDKFYSKVSELSKGYVSRETCEGLRAACMHAHKKGD